MLRLLWTLLRTLNSARRGYEHLVIENLVLRQQLATFKASRRRPRLRTADRAFWVALRRLWSHWADVLIVVKPETVVLLETVAGSGIYTGEIPVTGLKAGMLNQVGYAEFDLPKAAAGYKIDVDVETDP